MMRFNFFEQEGAFTRSADGLYTVDMAKAQAAMIKLVEKIIRIQGDGDYEAAKKWVEEEGVVKPQLQADLDRINAAGIPVDIIFNQGKQMLGL
jgi:hypothetical protein